MKQLVVNQDQLQRVVDVAQAEYQAELEENPRGRYASPNIGLRARADYLKQLLEGAGFDMDLPINQRNDEAGNLVLEQL